MGFEKELEEIQQFIDNFDTNEFSSTENFIPVLEPSEVELQRAAKIKGRMCRKHKMAEVFKQKLENEYYNDQDVCISQDDIDALLASSC